MPGERMGLDAKCQGNALECRECMRMQGSAVECRGIAGERTGLGVR